MTLNILLPVYNEEERLEKGVCTLIEYINNNISIPVEINIIDNASTDTTRSIAESLCSRYSIVHYSMIKEKGLGAAVRYGVINNKADLVGYMDIDMATDINNLKTVVELFCNNINIEFINASRFAKESKIIGKKWYRNITSYFWLLLMKLLLDMKATDSICGFKFFRKECLLNLMSEVKNNDNGWFYIIELLIRAERNGTCIYELPVLWTDDGKSKVKIIQTSLNYLRNIFRLRKEFKIEHKKS